MLLFPSYINTDCLIRKKRSKGGVDYILSDFAKALKDNSLNFDEGLNGRNRILAYDQITPLSIAEPATWQDLDKIFNNNDIVIDGNGHK